MEKPLPINEEDLGMAGGLLMRHIIFNSHRHDNGMHIVDICESEDKFRNLSAIFFAYAHKQRLDFSSSFSDGVGRIRLERKQRSIFGAFL